MVQIRSFVFEGQTSIPIEVELTLWPGLPQILFLGRPDQNIRESSLRIKSAIKAQGFRFPKAQQILVNLRPHNVKKTSKGVELAVALAYLMESEQIPFPDQCPPDDWAAYGELSLGGLVHRPDDLDLILRRQKLLGVVTGSGPSSLPVQNLCLSKLSDLKLGWGWAAAVPAPTSTSEWRNEDQNLWSSEEAELMQIVAAGEHSLFLAGPAGSGKSTLAANLHECLPGAELRNLVRPHNRIPASAFLGGGSSIHEGEIQRANGGTLILDEFLEFHSEVIEGLRQPLEDGVIRLARQGKHQDLPCRFLLLATSNLCPCGEWVPGQQGAGRRCRFSLKKCRSYSERFSGPLMDRFQMVAFAASPKLSRDLPLSQIRAGVAQAVSFRQRQRGQELPNSYAPLREIEQGSAAFILREMLPQSLSSVRRQRSTLRVARSLADLSESPEIRMEDLRGALKWTYQNMSRLQSWD